MKQRLEPDPDLEALVRKLNDQARDDDPSPDAVPMAPPAGLASPTPRWTLTPPTEEGGAWLNDLLKRAREAFASDLLIVAGSPPVIRVNGRLEPLGNKALSDAATEMLCASIVPVGSRVKLEDSGAADFSFSVPELGRFRCNVHRERGRWSAAVRVFPDAAPDLDELNLPGTLARFSELEHGFVLVTGPTGCGKSTTLAALIGRILARRNVHVITIEDPVEYEHPHGDSVLEHIEIGRDVPSFPQALRSALRQDPDVLLVGEMRDRESISIAITAAETGHLVLSTLHTGDAPQTISRILDSYPPSQIETVRAQISVSLAGIVSQQLLPRRDGEGRVPAVEILVATPAVRNIIRRSKLEQLRSQLTLEASAGMLSLDTSLAQLVRDGLVDQSEARTRARIPEEFDRYVRLGGPSIS